MSNESLIKIVLSACRSYEAGEISLAHLVSSVELNVGALEGLLESERSQLRSLAAALEQAQFEYDDEDCISKTKALVKQLIKSLQSVLRVGSAA